MKIITFNANGIRSASRKGFFDWLSTEQSDVDVVCIQETKAQTDQLTDPMFHPEGYHSFYCDAQKKGYSGTAIYTKRKPEIVTRGLGWDPADSEGRILKADFEELSVISLYMPSGSSGEERQNVKFDFLSRFYEHMKEWESDKNRSYIICADWNICHKEEDLKNWRANRKNSGFLPEERAWLDSVYSKLNWVDSFRCLEQQEHEYTWWSNRGQAYANNVGWRLDYQMVTQDLRDKVIASEIYKTQRFSDHAPLIMEYDFDF
jgi:exodeoxyribonuclease III